MQGSSTFVWIASYLDGELRFGTPRLRRKLPPVGWLRERLISHGGPGFDQTLAAVRGTQCGMPCPWQSPPPGSRMVRALAKVAAVGCQHSQGPLSLWSPEADVQREPLDLPLDAYTLRIISIWPCVVFASFVSDGGVAISVDFKTRFENHASESKTQTTSEFIANADYCYCQVFLSRVATQR